MPGGDAPRRLTRATVEIDGASVTILPKRAPVGNSGPIRGRTLAIYPDVPERSTVPELPPGEVLGRIEPGNRPAHAILDVTEAEALARGSALGLDEILFWDGRRAQILACP